MSIINAICLIIYGVGAYWLGRNDQSQRNAQLLYDAEQELDNACREIARLEAEAAARQDSVLRKDAIRRQEISSLADE